MIIDDEEMEELEMLVRKNQTNLLLLAAKLKKQSELSDSDEEEKKESRPYKRRHREPMPNYEDAPWMRLLRLVRAEIEDDTTNFQRKKFRDRFRVSFTRFENLLELTRSWLDEDGKKIFPEKPGDKRYAPLELKVLAVLRVLALGCGFNAVTDASFLGESTINNFFHEWLGHFVKKEYEEWVYWPKPGDDLKHTIEIYAKCGLPGCCGSVDVVHIPWVICPSGLKSACNGKEGYPTVAYQVTVDHLKRIRNSTNGFFGARNDKHIVRSDKFVVDLKEKKIYSDIGFTLRLPDGGTKRVRGLYLICDGGYHFWRVLQCTIKNASDDDTRVFSSRVESLRKDVECVFGIMKKRHKILCRGIEIRELQHIDNVFFACCIIHNMLLEDDGWADRYKKRSYWNKIGPGAGSDNILSAFSSAETDTADTEDDTHSDLGDFDERELIDDSALTRNTYMRQAAVAVGIERENEHFDLRRDLINNLKMQFLDNEVYWLC